MATKNTYRDLIIEGSRTLEKSDINEAALDARLLLEYICHTDVNTLYAHPELIISDLQAKMYWALIEERAKHIPLQHLTGSQEFMGLDFYVNEHVLIPRQDTEFLVEEAMRYTEDGMTILDMCTGSGCILLSLMNYKNDCIGVGADISDKALEVARVNADRLSLDPILLSGDLFEALEGEEARRLIKDKLRSNLGTTAVSEGDTGAFDIIISNPPYIRSDVIPELDIEVKDHDPMAALDGGEDGLIFYRRIATGAKKYLTNYGRIFFEIGYDQGEEVSDILIQEGYKDVTCLNDYAGNPRVVHGVYVKDVCS